MDDNFEKFKDTVKGLEDMVYGVIDNRFYQTMMKNAEETGDKDAVKIIEGINLIAKKNDMTFIKLFQIITELSMLFQKKE